MECGELLVQEYFKIVDIISAYDDRILVIKGWGVTFSLVMLATAFQKKAPSLFWIASLSALCFYILDGTYKNYQTNYYPQMRNIEILCASENAFSNTGIDWGWDQSNDGVKLDKTKTPKPREPDSFLDSIFNLGVILPYIFPFLFGLILGCLSIKSESFRHYMANKSI